MQEDVKQYLGNFGDWLLKWPIHVHFILSFVFGVVAILLSGITGWFWSFGFFLPVFIMLYYAVAGIVTYADYTTREKFSDSLYYIGFLFTLVALGMALFAIDSSEDALNQVIPRFGLALTTTILGLAMRVLSVNFENFDDIDLSTPADELSHAIRRFREDVIAHSETLRQLNDHSISACEEITKQSTERLAVTISQFESYVVSATESLQKGVIDLIDHLNSAIQNSISELATATDLLAAEIRNIGNLVSEPLVETANKVTSIIEPVAIAYDKLSEVAEQTTETYRSISNQVSEIAVGLDKLKNSIAISHEGAEEIRATGRSIGEIGATVVALSDRLDGLTGRIETLSNGITTAVQEMEAPSLSIKKFAGEMGVQTEIVREHNQLLRDGLEDSRQQALEIESSLRKTAATIEALLK